MDLYLIVTKRGLTPFFNPDSANKSCLISDVFHHNSVDVMKGSCREDKLFKSSEAALISLDSTEKLLFPRNSGMSYL